MSRPTQQDEYKNIIVAGMWKTRNGHFNSVPIDAKNYDTIMKNLELGCKLILRMRTEESIARSQNPEKTPVAYLEIVPKSEAEAFASRGPKGL